MKKIITAIDNTEINEKLKKEKNLKVICKDIIYKEGILEQIEKNNEIEIIIIDEEISGEISTKELIKKIKEKIKNIEIIIITKNKEKTKEEIKRFKKIKIYETNKIKIKKLLEIINSKKIEKFKKNQEKEIITISGARGVGKSITTLILSNINLDQKTLIIDYNPIENQDLSTILKKDKNKELEKINSKLDILTTNKIEKIKVNIKNKYKRIFIDLGDNKNKEEILEISTKNIIITEANLIGIKKTTKIINENIKKEKILLIINKINENSIDKKIIKEIFKKIKIIGEVKVNNKYEKIINKKEINIKKVLKKEEKREIEKILKEITKI